MSPLVKKELALQRPYLLLVLVVIGITVFDTMVSGYPDQRSLVGILDFWIASGGDGTSLMAVLVAFALGSGLLTREYDERNLEFLDALPISRWSIFASKVGVAALVLAPLPLLLTLNSIFLWTINQSSLMPPVNYSWVGQGLVLVMFKMAFFFSLGLLFSFLRSFAWMALALTVLGYQTLVTWYPDLFFMNILDLNRPRYQGDTWLWPTTSLAFAGTVATLSTAAAWILFRRLGDRLMVGRGLPPRWVGYLAVAGTVGSVATLMARTSSTEKSKGISVPPERFSSAQTRQYSFVYRVSQQRQAEALMTVADQTHQAVVTLLEIATATLTIPVDATGSARGTAGTAASRKIRLKLSDGYLPDHRSTLAHETVHIYINELAQNRLTHPRWDDFFHEGVATHLEHLVQPSEETQHLRRIAAIFWARHRVPWEQVWDRDFLTQNYDANLVYALGESFAEVFRRRAGTGGPKAVLAALARPELPENLSGLAQWRDAFMTAGWDFDQLGADWVQFLEEGRGEAKKFPRLLPEVRLKDGKLDLEINVIPPLGYQLACRLRLTPNDDPATYFTATGRYVVGCLFDIRKVKTDIVEYQVGYVHPQFPYGIWEPWTSVPVN